MNISSINLNLLLAFEALLEERSVTRASRRAGLSQPAMSNALARLRELFGDELFTRSARAMSPTPRALELAGPIRAGLAQFRAALDERPRFDPAASSRVFRLAMTDYAELILLPALARSIERVAPHVQIVARRLEAIFTPPEAELRAGAFDAALGFFPEASALDPGTRSLDLFTEDNVCIARKNHPLLRGRLTLRRLAASGHAAIFYRAETRGLVDNLLAGHGLRRRVRVATPHFLMAPFVVAASDLLAVVPEGLAAHFRKWLPIEVRKMPLLLPPFRMRLLWHEHSGDDPAQQWLREEIQKALSA